MRLASLLAIITVVLGCVTGKKSDSKGISMGASGKFEKVDEDVRVYRATAKEMFDGFDPRWKPDDREWVKTRLRQMFEVDQFARKYSKVAHDHNYTIEEKKYFDAEIAKEYSITEIDARFTKELKKLLAVHEWITISKFGEIADQNAWLVVQHADMDPQFQRQVLEVLEKLFPIGETNPKRYAYLYDRVAASFKDVSKRTLQRYGTQGRCTGPGKWEPLPIEDPAKVDERRKFVGLEPIEEYIARFKEICK